MKPEPLNISKNGKVILAAPLELNSGILVYRGILVGNYESKRAVFSPLGICSIYQVNIRVSGLN
jgi:hypothetical protein